MNLNIPISGFNDACIDHTYKIVYLVLPGRVSVRIEVSVLPVGAREDSKADFRDIVILTRTGLGPTERTFFGTATNVELVVVLREWREILRFNLLKVSSSLDMINVQI
jgi:hypothetical protein